jgi:hypothetical protein
MLVFLLHVSVCLSQANKETHLVMGVGISGIGGDESTPIGYLFSYGLIKGKVGFINSIGYSENDVVPIVRSATFTVQPVFEVTESFYLGFGPQLKTTFLGLMNLSYYSSANLRLGDQFMVTVAYSRFDKLGFNLQLLF